MTLNGAMVVILRYDSANCIKLVLTLATLNDLERRNGCYFAL